AEDDSGVGEDGAGEVRVAAAAVAGAEAEQHCEGPENQGERRDEGVEADPVGAGGLGVAQLDLLGEGRIVLRGEVASAWRSLAQQRSSAWGKWSTRGAS